MRTQIRSSSTKHVINNPSNEETGSSGTVFVKLLVKMSDLESLCCFQLEAGRQRQPWGRTVCSLSRAAMDLPWTSWADTVCGAQSALCSKLCVRSLSSVLAVLLRLCLWHQSCKAGLPGGKSGHQRPLVHCVAYSLLFFKSILYLTFICFFVFLESFALLFRMDLITFTQLHTAFPPGSCSGQAQSDLLATEQNYSSLFHWFI